MTKKIFLIFLISLIPLAGCTPREDDGKTNIVVTTTMLYDLVCEIGGDRVTVTGLMGPGIDPHLYQASAGDVIAICQADIIVYNGLHLEGKLGDVFASLEDRGTVVICAADGIPSESLITTDSGTYDPHIWFDVSLWQQVADHVAAELCSADPDNAEYFENNLNTYSDELTELHTYIQDCVSELPESARILITAHDAFRYFGTAYGFEVLGLQGIATDSEAGTSDMSRLADYICENRVAAVFPETSVSQKSVDALKAAVASRGFSVEIGGQLYSDSLNTKNDYILTFRSNIDTITDALKGGLTHDG